jgi:hypothetical protein
MRALAAALAVIASVLVASGCAGSGAKQTARYTTSPPTTSGAASQPVAERGSSASGPLVVPVSTEAMRSLRLDLFSPRFLTPTRLAIPGIIGSSNCPSVPAKLVVGSPHAIRVHLVVGSWGRTASGLRVQVPHSPGACLDDLHPVPVVIAINPKQIDVHHPLKVSLYYSKGVIRRFWPPIVVTVPPLATARIREEVNVARVSIFPKVPGKEICLIPHGMPPGQSFRGVCQTSVRSRQTHEPSVSVTFTESWWPHCPPMAACSPRALRHHTWQIIEGETMIKPETKPHVYVTRSHGARAPQDHK